MYGFFENPYRVLKLSHVLLIGGLIMLLVGIILAYGCDAYLTLPALVGAHAMTILGPTAIKLGYVMRLLAHNRLRLNLKSPLNGAAA
ncbi:transmembrane sensor/regulator PpyR [Pseudomonas sp.]|uniref:transmembrane sensor/regulator PpyR n=1 Tax=Pseudomonas sp. TaxID=306 RepID=UPI003F2A24FF